MHFLAFKEQIAGLITKWAGFCLPSQAHANIGKTGLGFYADGMVEHDALVGQLLDTVDKLGLSENTIVIYTTDNGPMVCVACNGKGYVIEKQRELVCSECQGRGEYLLIDSDRHHKQETQEVIEAR